MKILYMSILFFAIIVFGIMLISIALHKKTQKKLDAVVLKVRENYSGTRVVRAFNKETEEVAEFDSKIDELTKLQRFAGRISALMNPITYLIINFAVILLIKNGAFTVNIGGITQGELVALYNYMSQILVELIKLALSPLKGLTLGGTAVGTGLNAPKGFDVKVAEAISALTGKDFRTEENKFHALTSKDELVFAHGALKALAADMMKIANDVRWLASGPRVGLGEIKIPENEPGSSIMPGKVNPTQCEAVTMVAVQVMGNDVAVGLAASQGNFELNVFMPVCIYNFIQSARLLAEAIVSFDKNCASGIKANRDKMHDNLHNSLMLVTALNPYIGYENAAKTVKLAFAENISLKEACVKLGFLTAEKFDEVFHPEQMV